MNLNDKIFGCLAGGALGDAFGIRVEMMHYEDIQEQYGVVDHFNPLPWRKPSKQPLLEQWNPFGVQIQNEDGIHPLGRWSRETGVYTDDSRYKLLVCRAILRKGGPITGKDLAAEFLNYRLMAEGASDTLPTYSWEGPQRTYSRYVASLERLTAMMQAQRFCTPGWDTPLGLVHACDPASAANVGYSMAVAAATAALPGATIERVIENVLQYAGCLGSQTNEFSGRLNKLLDIAAHCKDVFDLREPFYRLFLVTFPPWEAVFSLEMVPLALAVCYIAKGDVEHAIIGSANAGRDSDTITSMVGELSGALYGIQGLPQAWVEQVLRLNPEPNLADLSRDLHAIVLKNARDKKNTTDTLLDLEE